MTKNKNNNHELAEKSMEKINAAGRKTPPGMIRDTLKERREDPNFVASMTARVTGKH